MRPNNAIIHMYCFHIDNVGIVYVYLLFGGNKIVGATLSLGLTTINVLHIPQQTVTSETSCEKKLMY